MKQYEADAIAKSIRNCRSSLEDKKDIVDMICDEMLKIDQFFNVKRFRDVAIQKLPDGWPNKMDKIYGNKN